MSEEIDIEELNQLVFGPAQRPLPNHSWDEPISSDFRISEVVKTRFISNRISGKINIVGTFPAGVDRMWQFMGHGREEDVKDQWYDKLVSVGMACPELSHIERYASYDQIVSCATLASNVGYDFSFFEGKNARPLGLFEENKAQPLEWENILSQASRNRDLMSLLMEKDWMGLQILFQVGNEAKCTFTDLSTMLNFDQNSLAPLITRLVLHGVLSIENQFFIITENGKKIIEEISSEKVEA